LDELLTCREDKYLNYSPLVQHDAHQPDLINYKQCIKNSIVQNNRLLSLLKAQTKDGDEVLEEWVQSLDSDDLKLDTNTRGVLLNRYRLIEAKWEDQFAASPAACLDSLHWTIKGFGLDPGLCNRARHQPGYKVDRRSVGIKPKECARLIIDLREQTSHRSNPSIKT
jgi:hypothetical protein